MGEISEQRAREVLRAQYRRDDPGLAYWSLPLERLASDDKRAIAAMLAFAQTRADREAIKRAVSLARHDWIASHGLKGMSIDDAIADAALHALINSETPMPSKEPSA